MLPSESTWSITSCDISIKWTAANGFIRGHVGVVLMMTGQLDSQRVRPRCSCHFSLHLGGSSTTAHLTIAAANTSSISHTLLRWCENQIVYTCITGMHITTRQCLLRSYKQQCFHLVRAFNLCSNTYRCFPAWHMDTYQVSTKFPLVPFHNFLSNLITHDNSS